jgi:hypothetical protein
MTPQKEFIENFLRELAGHSQNVTVIKIVGAHICWCLERAIDLLLEIRNNTTPRETE